MFTKDLDIKYQASSISTGRCTKRGLRLWSRGRFLSTLVGHAPVELSRLINQLLKADAGNIYVEIIEKQKREVRLVVSAKFSARAKYFQTTVFNSGIENEGAFRKCWTLIKLLKNYLGAYLCGAFKKCWAFNRIITINCLLMLLLLLQILQPFLNLTHQQYCINYKTLLNQKF